MFLIQIFFILLVDGFPIASGVEHLNTRLVVHFLMDIMLGVSHLHAYAVATFVDEGNIQCLLTYYSSLHNNCIQDIPSPGT